MSRRTSLTRSGKWSKFKREWLESHHQDVYTCALCLLPIIGEPVSLDHIIPLSDNPAGLLDENNVQPTHIRCNELRGMGLPPKPWNF